MKKYLRIFFATWSLVYSSSLLAQVQPTNKDSIVQLFGVVMTADSLRAVPSASVIVVDKGRGTITNNDGVFSIVVYKGDKITFSSVGFKDKTR